MGNEQPAQKQKTQVKQLDQFKIDVTCLKVKGYVELNRDRRTNQALTKEKNLNEMIRQPSRNKIDEYQKFQSLVTDIHYMEACNLVIRCCDVIKDQSIRIAKCLGDPSKIPDLMPYIETLLFAADNLNLQQVMEFKDLMVFYFGPGLYDTSKLQCVDPELKKLFKNPLPDAFEVNEFALKFSDKYGFSEDQLNACGHQFSSKYLQPVQGGIPGAPNNFQGGFPVGQDFPPGDFNQFGPPGGNPYGPPPDGFGGGNNYGPPPGGNNYGPPGGNNYGPPGNNYGPPGGNNYGPPGNNFGQPPPGNNYGPPSGNNYGQPPPPGNNYGPPSGNNPYAQFGPPGGQQNNSYNTNYGTPPPQQFQQGTNPYGQQNNMAPPNIMISHKLTTQTPNNQSNQPKGGNNTGDLDDLEARLNRLNGGL